jgi:outer membrane protein assembly factor BamB
VARPLNSPVSALPIVAGGRVYAGDSSGAIVGVAPNVPCAFAYDASSGKLLWSSLHGVISGLAMDQSAGLVYFGTQGSAGALYALEGTTGALRWHHQFGPGPVTTPILVNGTLYFTADGVYAFSALDGKVRWHNSLGASLSNYFTPVTMLNGTMYVAGTDGEGNTTLYALSTTDGSELWHVSGINQMSPPLAG